MAISFCDPEEMRDLRAIEKLLKQALPVKTDHPSYADLPAGPVEIRDRDDDRPRERRSHPSRSGEPRSYESRPQAPRQAHPTPSHPRTPQRPPHATSARPAHAPRPAGRAAPTGRGVVPQGRRAGHPLSGARRGSGK